MKNARVSILVTTIHIEKIANKQWLRLSEPEELKKLIPAFEPFNNVVVCVCYVTNAYELQMQCNNKYVLHLHKYIHVE